MDYIRHYSIKHGVSTMRNFIIKHIIDPFIKEREGIESKDEEIYLYSKESDKVFRDLK